MKQFNSGAYLSSLNIDVMRFGLESISDLLAGLGHPQNDYPSVLVGGTNGKGSTAAMLASILEQSGLNVGLYTSPHLVDVCERIVVGGVRISRRDLDALIAEISRNVRQPITYFECLTAAAFLFFSRKRVDIAVCEVGLGGRLDATNVAKPLASIITNIALEHTDYLGKTLAAIAGEKAGIIKPNGICITAATQKRVLDVLSNVCATQNARLVRLGVDINMKSHRDKSVTYEGEERTIKKLTLPLRGRHQTANLALALAAVEILETKGFRIEDSAVRGGLAHTCWEARGEILCSRPLFLLDGAHNPAGITTLCRILKKDFFGRRIILIFSALADKDYRRMLGKILPLADRIFLPPLSTKRACPPRQLAAFAESLGHSAAISRSTASAVRQAFRCARKGDLIVACGSLYLAGEVKEIFSEMVCCDKKRYVK